MRNEKTYNLFIKEALNCGFTYAQVNWLEKYVYESNFRNGKEIS